MELRAPLAILDSCFTPSHGFDVVGIDLLDVQITGLKDRKQRHPVDTGRFHDHRLDSTLLSSLDDGIQIRCKRSTTPS